MHINDFMRLLESKREIKVFQAILSDELKSVLDSKQIKYTIDTSIIDVVINIECSLTDGIGNYGSSYKTFIVQANNFEKTMKYIMETNDYTKKGMSICRSKKIFTFFHTKLNC